ncbi:MAG TPA: hypothetical protein VL738_18950 [Dactylosporangium sp.]|nr:hypothetical protein [Dactylosporangium sp.]
MSTPEPAPQYLPPSAPPGLGYVPQPPQPPRGPGRLLWLWVALSVVVLVAVAGGATAVLLARRWDGKPAVGDAAMTVRMIGPGGAKPSPEAVERTRQILLQRLRQLDVQRPTVTEIGAETLRVTVAQKDVERARSVLAPGNLTFRLVQSMTQPQAVEPGCKADAQERVDRAAALASAKAKLGSKYDAAVALQAPADGDAAAALTGFEALTCAEVAALPPAVQFNVPTVTCGMLDQRPAGALEDGAQAVACDDSHLKYLTDVAKVVGTDLASAKAELGQQGGGWTVTLGFTSAGQNRWTGLTREAMDKGQASGEAAQIAVTIDNHVVTAPSIMAVIPGDAQISGGDLSTRDGANALAATLSHGVLPVRLVIDALETVR